MKKIFKGLLSVSAIVLLAGCTLPIGPKTRVHTKINTNGNNNPINKVVNPSDNIKSSAELAVNERLIVFIENKNDFPVRMNVEVEFYDTEGKLVKSGKENFNGVRANGEIAFELYDTPEEFSDYKIFVDAEKEDLYFTFDKELEMTDNNTEEEVAVQVKNNSDNKIDWITVSVVYYKEGKAVGISEGIESDIKPGRSANFNIGYAYDKEYDDIEFDDYKVFLNEAYTYED